MQYCFSLFGVEDFKVGGKRTSHGYMIAVKGNKGIGELGSGDEEEMD
jgi:hypothetical protein